ncbi:ParB/RepB/Spo0J family partition protein [Flavobacteriaceae bacterium]|nr:ParB/RepB/Spo0J family partition protein [Flavobacteriaceae bacterium]MDB4067619.1 ParB/RepB/Spo0J family partition protein [Flavobacteriaceae bacterium]MDB4152961.1 ParB/RepB/Spo0J family partition protein [Flavobacteriaceae bacterium]
MAKSNKKQALGRGLSALLQDPTNEINSVNDKNADQVIGSVIDLELDRIEVNPFQPRTQFNDEALKQLASSIKELGIIQPITVRKMDYNQYQLVSGERRYRAAKLIGLSAVPAFVRLANDQESLEMALVENIQRQDLDPIEVALSYQRLIDEINITQEALSERVGKKRSTITNYLRLLKLDPIIQTGMRDGFLSMGHGRALLAVEDRDSQLKVYERIIKGDLSVRKTEAIVKALKNRVVSKTSPHKPVFIQEAIEDFGTYFESKVTISYKEDGKGVIHIPFDSQQDFSRMKKLLKREE